jgi:hypothetical protein
MVSYMFIFKFLVGSTKDSELNGSNILHALNFFMSAILMCYFVPKCLNSATFSNDVLATHALVTRYQHLLLDQPP